jgi:putative transposase
VENRLKESLKAVAAETGVNIEQVEVMPDHVRVFVKSDPERPPAGIVKFFKGRSSKRLAEGLLIRADCRHCGHDRVTANRWGRLSETTARKYVEDRENG